MFVPLVLDSINLNTRGGTVHETHGPVHIMVFDAVWFLLFFLLIFNTTEIYLSIWLA